MPKDTKIHKYDKFIPWYFVSFFLFLFVVDGTLFYLATSTHTGVVDKNYYETGLKYNKAIEANRKQEKLGWKTNIELHHNDTFTISLLDSSDKKINGAEITAVFFRPTQDGFDFNVDIKEHEESGIYTSKIDFPLRGLWEVKITATKGGDIYKYNKRIVAE